MPTGDAKCQCISHLGRNPLKLELGCQPVQRGILPQSRAAKRRASYQRENAPLKSTGWVARARGGLPPVRPRNPSRKRAASCQSLRHRNPHPEEPARRVRRAPPVRKQLLALDRVGALLFLLRRQLRIPRNQRHAVCVNRARSPLKLKETLYHPA